MKVGQHEIANGDKWITTTRGMSGHFAVMMWVNNEYEDLGPFAEPYDTGIGRYATKEEAEEEARYWAEDENLLFIKE